MRRQTRDQVLSLQRIEMMMEVTYQDKRELMMSLEANLQEASRIMKEVRGNLKAKVGAEGGQNQLPDTNPDRSLGVEEKENLIRGRDLVQEMILVCCAKSVWRIAKLRQN